MRRLGLALLVLLMPALASADTYTVGPSGRTYTTIGACLTAAQPGDICDVYTGDYTSAGVISSVRAGTSNAARITVSVHAGETATVRGFYVSHNYVTISGFTINTGTTTGLGVQVGAATYVTIDRNTIEAQRNSCVRFGGTSYSILSNNVIRYCGWALPSSQSGTGIELFSGVSYLLIDGNDIHNTTDDCVKLDGGYIVFRNNSCHDSTPDTPQGYNTAHIDFLHGSTPAMTHLLLEGNVVQNNTDSTGNNHLTWIEGPSSIHQYNIIRYNYTNNIDDATTPSTAQYSYSHFYVYNNTFTGGALGEGFCVSFPPDFTSLGFKNNICYANRDTATTVPHYGGASAPRWYNGNLVYEPGYSPSWTGDYASEATYATLANQNPLFANYPTTYTLQAASPAINHGASLTLVATADTGSGTTLVVEQAGYFYDGEGIVDADQIRIGTSTYATIASINYATNTITLVAGVARSDGDPVYLYKKSDGDIVLVGTLPDVGAYEYGSGVAAPGAPPNVRIR